MLVGNFLMSGLIVSSSGEEVMYGAVGRVLGNHICALVCDGWFATSRGWWCTLVLDLGLSKGASRSLR